MTLLYLAAAYLLGIRLGKWVWDYGLLHCDLPPWVWWVPFGLLLFVPLLHRWEVRREIAPHPQLRWPESAGFAPPRPPLSLALGTALLLCLGMGVLRYATHPLTPCWTPTDLAYYNLPASRAFDRESARLTLEGYIDAYPIQEDGRHRLYIAIETVVFDDLAYPVHGRLFLQSNDSRHYGYGDAVRLAGRLVTPPDFEDFSYREYLARSGVHSILYNAQIEPLTDPLQGSWFYRALFAVRARGESLINQSLPEPYAALANGILLGIDSGIPDDLYEQFNLAGISHLLVISGSNVALIVAVALALSQRIVGQRLAVYLALTAIALYAVFVGAEAAVLRAALMGGLVVFAGAINRRSAALISLAAAAACLTLINPLILWDIGFQLSSLATAGLILFTPPITRWVARWFPDFQGGVLTSTHLVSATAPQTNASSKQTKGLLYGLITDSLIVTLAANVMVLPLIVFYFGRLSVISIVANLLVAAVQPLILLSGTAGLLIGLLGLGIVAKVFLWVAWLGLYWTTFVARWAVQLPGASLEVTRFGWGGLVITYALVFALRFWNHQMLTRNLRHAWPIDLKWMNRLQPLLIGALVCTVGLVWSAASTLPDGKLHIYFLHVDGGSGMLIQTPMGRQILIDGGPIPQRLVSELGKVMPFWDRTLDLMVVTQAHGRYADALAEIPLRYHIDQAIAAQEFDGDPWRASLALAETPVTTMQGGGWIDLGDGVALWALWPPPDTDVNHAGTRDQPLVMKLVYDDFSLLMTGDNSPLELHSLIESGTPLRSKLLQVAASHDDSAYDELMTSVNPQLAVIHGGRNLQVKPSTKQELTQLTNGKLLQTDLVGRTHIYTDGQKWWIEE